MAYRVLIADDEPIILSGIRHLIQWEEADAQIVAAAANGQEAYSLIESEHPDIVITDIRMPVIDGLALAGRCSEEHPDIVFIILTSLAEFSLAKEAIGYGISDYLLKTELDSGKLMDALLKAEEECRRRREGMMRSSPDPENRTATILSSLMIMRDVTPETRSYLSEHGLLGDSAIIASAFAFPSPSLEKQWSAEDYAKLHDWEKDIVEKILSSSFVSFWPVMPVAGNDYYLDRSGKLMPKSSYYADLVVATGHITPQYARQSLLRLGRFIQEDPFWNNQIQQINVTPAGKVELVPRVGEHVILLGMPTNVEDKLNRMKLFYTEGLNKVGWNKYSEICLEYDNQIICKKNKK